MFPHSSILGRLGRWATFLCLSLAPGLAGAIWQVEDNAWPVRVGLDRIGEPEATRQQYLGPFVETYRTESVDWTAVRPFTLHTERRDLLGTSSLQVLYPFFSFRDRGFGYDWDLFYLLRGSHYTDRSTPSYQSFELFPLYFDVRDRVDPEESYWGLLPLYGTVKNRFFRDRISWVLFPFYTEWENNGSVTYGTPWPFVRYRTGGGASGFALWPLYGHFEKPGDYSRTYWLWPLGYDFRSSNGPDQPETRRTGMIPFYTYAEGPQFREETYIWPFFGYTKREDPRYRETRYFWPFFVQGRGTPYVNRWAPFYTHSIRKGVDKKWWLWPLFKHRQWEAEEDRVRVREWSFLYFLYWQQQQTALQPENDFRAGKTFAWPFFSHWNNGAGTEQFQLFSPLQGLFRDNETIARLYSPLFGIYRYERSEPEEAWRHSLLFNLLTLEKEEKQTSFSLGPLLKVEGGPKGGGFSLLKGLLGHRRQADGSAEWQFLWMKL